MYEHCSPGLSHLFMHYSLIRALCFVRSLVQRVPYRCTLTVEGAVHYLNEVATAAVALPRSSGETPVTL